MGGYGNNVCVFSGFFVFLRGDVNIRLNNTGNTSTLQMGLPGLSHDRNMLSLSG